MQNLAPKPGDLIGFSGESLISDFINIATYGIPRWGLSHIGIMGEATDGRLLLFESTTLDPLPCAITGKTFDGTQAHTLDDVVAGYRGKVWKYDLYRELYPSERDRLTHFLTANLHIPYDQMGAFRSGGENFSYIESLLRDEDLTSIFCSELVAAALDQIGISPAGNASRYNPNKLARRLLKAGMIHRARRLK